MNKKDMVKSFNNVKTQIGYCGIWCGSCVVGNGILSYLAARYKKLIDAYDLPQWGPKDIDYALFKKALSSIQELAPCVGCIRGGGRDQCEMRVCAVDRRLMACSECRDEKKCDHRRILTYMRSGAIKAGLFVITKKADKRKLIKNWTLRLKRSWPGMVLSMGNGG